jgi:hypothetical protein
LIRRVTLDLIGLPPTPEEVEAFVQDESPKAYEALIDRLLASPHYGERWGRHWLDLARYADTSGFHNDLDRPYAWKYRDYVIRSFNDDKPYARFVAEQIAGDEIDGADEQSLIATGFCRNGTSNDDNMGKNDDALAQYRADQLDDVISTTSSVFLGLTVGCARCHDHKTDPLAGSATTTACSPSSTAPKNTASSEGTKDKNDKDKIDETAKVHGLDRNQPDRCPPRIMLLRGLRLESRRGSRSLLFLSCSSSPVSFPMPAAKTSLRRKTSLSGSLSATIRSHGV